MQYVTLTKLNDILIFIIYFFQAQSLYVLFEHAVGYSLFQVKEFDELALLAPRVEQSVLDLGKFNSVVKTVAFAPFKTGHNSLDNLNSISEGKQALKSHRWLLWALLLQCLCVCGTPCRHMLSLNDVLCVTVCFCFVLVLYICMKGWDGGVGGGDGETETWYYANLVQSHVELPVTSFLPSLLPLFPYATTPPLPTYTLIAYTKYHVWNRTIMYSE